MRDDAIFKFIKKINPQMTDEQVENKIKNLGVIDLVMLSMVVGFSNEKV